MKPYALYLGSLSALALMGLAGAANAQSAKIENAVARVVVIPENRSDIGVEIVAGSADLPQLQVKRRGNDVEIDGQLASRGNLMGSSVRIGRCNSGSQEARQPGEGAVVEVRGHGRIKLEDAPLIVLRMPLDVDLSASGSVFGSVGPGVRSLYLGSAGCGSWTVGNVEQSADLSVAGSGGVRMGSSRSLKVSIGGSGSVNARQTEDLNIAIGGSGNVQLAHLSGPARVRIAGSGDVRISEGRADNLDVSIAGSGDTRFDGIAHNVKVSIAGSGDVYVREATGSVSRSVAGSGRLHIAK